jgi:hypothetical protein
MSLVNIAAPRSNIRDQPEADAGVDQPKIHFGPGAAAHN